MAGNNRIAVMTRDNVHLFGHWECVEGVYFSNLYWDRREEFRLFRRNSFPHCGRAVIPEDDLFPCFECNNTRRQS